MPWALGFWSDRTFFQNSLNLIFGTLSDKIPQDFIEDRSSLRGAPFDVNAMKAAIPQMRDQLRSHADWIDAQLAGGREWLLDSFSLADVNAYMNIWSLRFNIADAGTWLAEFPCLLAWEKRVQALGHGERSEMTSGEALQIASEAQPETPVLADPNDPNGRQPGDTVSIAPDDYGKVAVTGEIVSLSAQHIAIRRKDERAGEIVAHFPRAGFLLAAG